ncbi:hypothetical protein GN958_ATG17629 [Phytophthora infestans]|uniref:Uncharacterized protein n=1 Tax=Phytophthora infestans TaxID=4787 RepID=A0A8S9TWS6_PHYIN|nr:hypothetical protein GN958_ATG17629 [Phytophthora infestans]
MSVATTAATSSSDDFDSFAFELDDVHETDVLVDVNESHLSMMTSVVSQSNGRSRKNQPKNPGMTKFVESKTLQSGETAPLVQRFIARRFEDESCIVHTWKFITEGAGVFNGMQVDETGWCRLLPSTDATEPGTQIELCIHRVPMHFKSVLSRKSEIPEFHEALQAVSAVTLNKVMTSLEALLLDGALAGIA